MILHEGNYFLVYFNDKLVGRFDNHAAAAERLEAIRKLLCH